MFDTYAEPARAYTQTNGYRRFTHFTHWFLASDWEGIMGSFTRQAKFGLTASAIALLTSHAVCAAALNVPPPQIHVPTPQTHVAVTQVHVTATIVHQNGTSNVSTGRPVLVQRYNLNTKTVSVTSGNSSNVTTSPVGARSNGGDLNRNTSNNGGNTNKTGITGGANNDGQAGSGTGQPGGGASSGNGSTTAGNGGQQGFGGIVGLNVEGNTVEPPVTGEDVPPKVGNTTLADVPNSNCFGADCGVATVSGNVQSTAQLSKEISFAESLILIEIGLIDQTIQSDQSQLQSLQNQIAADLNCQTPFASQNCGPGSASVIQLQQQEAQLTATIQSLSDAVALAETTVDDASSSHTSLQNQLNVLRQEFDSLLPEALGG
jgi:hypothetical protein